MTREAVGGATGERWRPVAQPLAGIVGSVVLWWLVVALFRIRPLLLPAPSDVVAAFRRQPGYLLSATWATTWTTLVGFALAAPLGLLVAMLLTASRPVERTTLPVLVALNSVPKVALAPLLVVWLGFGVGAEIVMVVLICSFPVVVSAMAGLTSTPPELIDLARSMSASRWRSYRKVRLPWALPQIFTGLKVAVSLSLIGAVVAEIATPNRGLGAVIVLSGSSLDTPLAFAAVALLATLSLLLFYTVVAAERWLVPWASTTPG